MMHDILLDNTILAKSGLAHGKHERIHAKYDVF